MGWNGMVWVDRIRYEITFWIFIICFIFWALADVDADADALCSHPCSMFYRRCERKRV